jgi:hypothetical protein
MSDDDDYITVNITKDQTSALAFVLTQAGRTGILDSLSPDLEKAFFSFIETMTVEIDRQKLNALGSN